MKTKIILALIAFLPLNAFAGNAVIFSGSSVKALKQNLDLNGQASILSGTVDPSSSATSAPAGSLYLNTSTGNIYKKTDAGSSTNWTALGASSSVDQSYELSNLAIAASVGSSALTISLKTKAGTNPSGSDIVKIGFRNSTSATGTYNQRSVTGSLSVVVSSGSTLGHSSGNAHFIYVYAIDNAGTVELAVSSVMFDDGSIQSTTAEGGAGAADFNRVMYSTTARTGVPVRLIGRLTVTEATAGTWATAPSEISPAPFYMEPVVAIYSRSTSQTITANTLTTVDYNTKEVDNYNAVATGTWLFTAPKTGYYSVSAVVRSAAAADTSERILSIVKNGSEFARLYDQNKQTSSSISVFSEGSRTVKLTAGDTLEIQTYQNSGGSLGLIADGTVNWVSIHELVGTRY